MVIFYIVKIIYLQ